MASSWVGGLTGGLTGGWTGGLAGGWAVVGLVVRGVGQVVCFFLLFLFVGLCS